MNIVEGEGLPDFVMMDEISESAFMENLKLRFLEKKLIYTYIGEQIVAMNPFTKVPLYTDKILKSYRNMLMYEMPPHIYALAEDTFRNMVQQKRDQCVIITGESGAGKTEASKIFMQYIAAVSAGKGGHGDVIKSHLLDSNPILEAFGNAKTLRNDNSSRFGKYMEIQFDGIGCPLAGRINRYLLEKSRVTTRAHDERSFHIFYMLLSQESLCSSLGLPSDPSQLQYLSSSGCYKVKQWNDVKEFADMTAAMSRLGFSDENKQSIWSILAGVLLLGNISFVEGPPIANAETCAVADESLLPRIAELLKVDCEALKQALVSRSISSGVAADTSDITIYLSIPQAEFARDSIARALYNECFSWVVDTINVAIKQEKGNKAEMFIGVLDIYGFEIFEINSFEQFCINYCNERLQQLFIKLVLKSEQEEYIREGIEWTEIDYFNNEPIVSLIDGKTGLFKTLDDICAVGQATPDKLLKTFEDSFSSHKHFTSRQQYKGKDKVPPNSFRITHYAGTVDYNVSQFIFKNRDTLFESSKACVQASHDPLMKSLFPPTSATTKRPPTASTQFVINVKDLVAKLEASHPHYIRCVKSNDQKKAFNINEERVRHQARYLNLVETVRVRRAGFCAKLPYDRFLSRYKLVCPKTWPLIQSSERAAAQTIMSHLGIVDEEFRKGETKLFVKNPVSLVALEKAREKHLPRIVAKLQALYRGYKARKFVREQRTMLELRKHGYVIWRAWMRHQFKLWLDDNMDQFCNHCGRNDNWGKHVQLQPLPGRLARAIPYMKRIQLTWWGTKKTLSLSAADRLHMRQKVLALDLFKGNKPWNVPARFEADYMSKDPKNGEVFKTKIQEFFSQNGDEKIMFADLVMKVNRKGKSQERVIVISDQNIYKFDPRRYNVRKDGIPLQQIKDVAMSPFADKWIVLHMKPPTRDLVLNMGVGKQQGVAKNGVRPSPSEKYSEIVTVLHTLLKGLRTDEDDDNFLPLTFEKTMSYNNSRDEEGDEEKKGEDVEMKFEELAGSSNKGRHGHKSSIFGALGARLSRASSAGLDVRGRSATVTYEAPPENDSDDEPSGVRKSAKKKKKKKKKSKSSSDEDDSDDDSDDDDDDDSD